jgi:putative transposase
MPYRNKNKRNQRNAFFHAYNRGFEKRQIFHEKFDYEMFIALIKSALKKCFYFNIHAFCLMPNHYHLLVSQNRKNEMGRFFQLLNSEYSRFYNWKYKRSGQLWQGTYRASFIKDAQHYAHELHYIHHNPSDIVEKPENYRYSSFPHYLGKISYKFIKKGSPHA